MATFTCFQDKVALITGAGGALGGGTAYDFSAAGARLALLDINQERLENVKEELLRRGHDEEKVFTRVGDVTKQEQIVSFVSDTVAKFGRIDHVINIVGHKRMGRLEDVTVEDLDDCLNGCVRGSFIVSKAALPYLIQSKGSIVNMGSVSGIRAFHSAVPYGTAKAALNHMTQIMASGLASKGVRVNCVCPSTVYTDFNMVSGKMTQEQMDKYLATSIRAMPMGRLGEVKETTNTILYLCSESAGFITGQILAIDGAYTQTLYEPPPQS